MGSVLKTRLSSCLGPTHPSTIAPPCSVTLQAILERLFPEEYEERRGEVEGEKVVGREILPLFVMDSVLPGQKMALNIFEPRYRLMIRRIMEGDHRMGMVGVDRRRGVMLDLACEVKIAECDPLPDGRFYIEVEGMRRFSITSSWEQDGYRVAQVEWMQDTLPEAGSEEAAKLSSLAEEVAGVAREWVARVLSTSRANRRSRLIEHVRSAGDIPPASQPERLSFWLANLLPIAPEEKLSFLRMTDPAERLSQELTLLRAHPLTSCHLQ
ncbi:hypothetical protein CLOP_g3526 [Closterium sp. NIES-67]|nr:hypothetical protein CLOP_g3526 [Closterium sp. NIES-67]